MASADPVVRVEPVFFKNSDVLLEENKWLTTWESVWLVLMWCTQEK